MLESIVNCLAIWDMPAPQAQHLQRSLLLSLLDQLRTTFRRQPESIFTPSSAAVCTMAVDLVLYGAGVTASTVPEHFGLSQYTPDPDHVEEDLFFRHDNDDSLRHSPEDGDWLQRMDRKLQQRRMTLSDQGFVLLLWEWLQEVLDAARARLKATLKSNQRSSETAEAELRVIECILSEQLLRLLLWLLHPELVPADGEDDWNVIQQRLRQVELGVNMFVIDPALWKRLAASEESFALVLAAFNTMYHRLCRLRDLEVCTEKPGRLPAVNDLLLRCEMSFSYLLSECKVNVRRCVDLDGSYVPALEANPKSGLGYWHLELYQLTEAERFNVEMELGRKRWLQTRQASERNRLEIVVQQQRQITTSLTQMMTDALQRTDDYRKQMLRLMQAQSEKLAVTQTLWHRLQEQMREPTSLWHTSGQPYWMLNPRESSSRKRLKLERLTVNIDMADRAYDYHVVEGEVPAVGAPQTPASSGPGNVNATPSPASMSAVLAQTPLDERPHLSAEAQLTLKPDTPGVLATPKLKRMRSLKRMPTLGVVDDNSLEASLELPPMTEPDRLRLEVLVDCLPRTYRVRRLSLEGQLRACMQFLDQEAGAIVGNPAAIASDKAVLQRLAAGLPSDSVAIAAPGRDLSYLLNTRGTGAGGAVSPHSDGAHTPNRDSDLFESPGGSNAQHGSLQPQERVHLAAGCEIITPFRVTKGEVLVGNHNLYFVADHGAVDASQNKGMRLDSIRELGALAHDPNQLPYWRYSSITQVLRRRYLLQHVAIEVFFSNGATLMLAFSSSALCKEVHQTLLSQTLINLDMLTVQTSEPSLAAATTTTTNTGSNPSLQVAPSFLSVLRVGGRDRSVKTGVTQRWCRGEISNFDYLMQLNTLAGRSFNDLTQYPVMPHVLADYTSEKLNLQVSGTYRDLRKPMGALDPERLAYLQARMQDAKGMWEDELAMAQQEGREPMTMMMPFLYGTHYSSAGAVLHYLARYETERLYYGCDLLSCC